MADETKKYIIDIESNLKEYADESVKAKAKVDELTEANKELKKSGKEGSAEFEANKAALKNANDEYRKAQSLLKTQIAYNQSETGSRKQLSEQLKLQEQALGKLGNAYITNAKGQKELNPLYVEQRNEIAKTKQSIIDYDLALNDGRSNIGRYGESVKAAMGAAGTGVSQLSSAIGGVTGQMGNLLSDFMTAGGAAGVLTAAIALLAAAWKRTQENIELYLKSADKVQFGFSGFTKDAEAARVETRRRAEGQVSLGVENLRLANYRMDKASTEEEKKQLELMSQQAYEMIKEGNALKDQVTGQKNRITWTLKYNELLQEQEKIVDSKLEKETEWELLEANLIKQRAIVTDQESTSAQKKQAAIDADVIANKLLKDKTDFVDRELFNVNAIAEMTLTQEAVEERVNGLLREKNAILKQYYADQIKINKLDKTANKDDKETEQQRLIRLAAEDLQIKKDAATAEIEAFRTLLNEKKYEEITLAEEAGAETYEIRKKYADAEVELAKLTNEDKLGLAAGFAGNIAVIFGKNTAIGKAAAVAETVINTYAAAMAAYKSFAKIPVVGVPLGIAAAAATVTMGAIAVKNILAVKSGLPGDGGGGSTSMPTAITASAPAQRTFAASEGSTFLNTPKLSNEQLNALPSQSLLTAADIADAIKNMPPPVVTVEDINNRSSEVRKIAVRATI